MSAQTKHGQGEQGATDHISSDMLRIGNKTVQMERPLFCYLHCKFTPQFSTECFFHAGIPSDRAKNTREDFQAGQPWLKT